jgi:hypothetical protein
MPCNDNWTYAPEIKRPMSNKNDLEAVLCGLMTLIEEKNIKINLKTKLLWHITLKRTY